MSFDRIALLRIACVATVTALAGCATTEAERQNAAANEVGCKAVVVYSASEAIRNEVRGSMPAASDALRRAEGAAEINRAEGSRPRALRAPPGSGVLHDAARSC